MADTEDDRRFLDLVRGFASPEHLALLEREVALGSRRIQPQEVLGACARPPPVGFDDAHRAGEQVLAKLDAGPGRGLMTHERVCSYPE